MGECKLEMTKLTSFGNPKMDFNSDDEAKFQTLLEKLNEKETFRTRDDLICDIMTSIFSNI